MLKIKNISKKYKNFALKDISFEVKKGDYFILLGNSGSGKSLLLELIAGLINANSGKIFLNDKDITNYKIQNRKIGLVFQDYALFPHFTVKENLLFPIKNKKTRIEKVNEIADLLNITHILHRFPEKLSGGEAQRVALGRTLITNPEILLLDEPLSSLDVQLRSGLRHLLKKINQNGQTIIHVTHDYDEAIALASKVAVIDNGKIIQQGDTDSVFKNPSSEFIANFIGLKNFFKSILHKKDEKSFVIADNNTKICLLSDNEEGEGFVMIRSEDIFIYDKFTESSALNNFEGIIKDAVPSRLGIEIAVKSTLLFWVLITKESYLRMNLFEGKKVWISFKASAVKFLKT
ncbi:MAG: ABC transporter ATP-binding protein [Bacteroidales bacterium]|nr:ABC transporter ATP-binding protein [Bacteroidales bacterium]MBN2757416.1 ABC transporter ATP-binding protein [Bacteroidales bacterium]